MEFHNYVVCSLVNTLKLYIRIKNLPPHLVIFPYVCIMFAPLVHKNNVNLNIIPIFVPLQNKGKQSNRLFGD